MSSRSIALLVLLAMGFAPGCATVKPWERGAFARDDMTWDPDPLETARRGHVYFSKEAAMDGAGAGGGGCGCN